MLIHALFKITLDSHYTALLSPGPAMRLHNLLCCSVPHPKSRPASPPPAWSTLIGHKPSPCKTATASALACSFPTHSTSQYIHFCESPELLVITDTFACRAGSSALWKDIPTPAGKGNKVFGSKEEEGRLCSA